MLWKLDDLTKAGLAHVVFQLTPKGDLKAGGPTVLVKCDGAIVTEQHGDGTIWGHPLTCPWFAEPALEAP